MSSNSIFKLIALVCIILLAVTGYAEYFDYHQYYKTLLANGSTIRLVLWGIVGATIPTLYLLFSKNKSLRGFIVSMLVGLIFYGACLVSARGGLFGLGIILLSRNTLLLFGFGIVQTVFFLVAGDAIKQKILPDTAWSWQRIGISLAIGLSAQLLLLNVLVLTNTLFPLVSRVLFVGAVYRIWKSWSTITSAWSMIVSDIQQLRTSLSSTSLEEKLYACITVFLLIASFWYVLNGFELSFMPYTTAWDANHAYMFYPKMWALNNGYYRFESSMQTVPQLWYMFLTYWFSLFGWTDGIGTLSADTIVLSINFRSGIYVLFLGVVLMKTFGSFFKKSILVQITGWGLMLLWLTSGMGAFLVFVDNKTDLGVLTLIISAIISGFVALKTLTSHDSLGIQEKKLLIISGCLYGVAALAKATAMFDVINFVMYLWGVLIGPLGILMIALLVIGILTFIEFRGIRDYLPKVWGLGYLGGGLLTGLMTLIVANKKRFIFGFTAIIIWISAFAVTKIVVKVPYLIAKVIVQDRSPSESDFIKSIFLSNAESPAILLAQSSQQSLGQSCSLASQGFGTTQDLYEDLKAAPGDAYNEDNVRYAGFGWKGNPSDKRRGVDPFVGTRRTDFIPMGCSIVSLNYRSDLRVLCENHNAIQSFDPSVIGSLSQQVGSESYHGKLLNQIQQAIVGGTDINQVRSSVNPQLQELLVFIESSTLYKNPETGEVFFPYKWLVPFNVSYNRSLQNLSSYYTDIGIIWLICFLFAPLGLVYGLVTRKMLVVVSSSVTLAAWILWRFIASGIVWYSIGLIIWSILSFVAFVGDLFADQENERPLGQIASVMFFATLGGVLFVQLVLNMVRIASQGGTGAFMRYKSSVGRQQVINDSLQPEMKLITGFGKEEVFNMQFPHYTPFIEAMNARNDDEGGLIAGTYIRYFIENQSGIKYDQFLTRLREKFSDNDVCNSYLRLQDQAIRYMAIDLNIGTVVQGEGNRSLFDRFFARVNTATNTIEDEGVISMLIALNQQGYVRYLSSNNIGAKYAFTMSDSMFDGLEGESLRLFKARMSVPRYFRNDSQLTQSILEIAQQRVADGTFVTDIADILGLQVRDDVVVGVVRSGQITQQQVSQLTQDEKKAVAQYFVFANLQVSNPEQLTQTLLQTINQSISNPNQILSLEVVK